MSSDVHVQDLSCCMVKDEENIERRKVPHRYYEEIHGCDLRDMEIEKVLPVPSGSLCSFRHVFPYRVDVDAITRHL